MLVSTLVTPAVLEDATLETFRSPVPARSVAPIRAAVRAAETRAVSC